MGQTNRHLTELAQLPRRNSKLAEDRGVELRIHFD
jgi:hypothetical protein